MKARCRVLRRASCALVGALFATASSGADGPRPERDGTVTAIEQPTLMAQATAAPSKPPPKPATVVVGKTRVPLVSSLLDQQCVNMIEPFDMLDSAIKLGLLVTRASGEILTSGKLTGDGVTHRLSRKTREEAMKLNWLPQSVERRIGLMLHQRAVDERRIVDRAKDERGFYAKAEAMLAEMKADLPPSGYKFELHLRNSPEQNATALPGGIIHIDVGLLAKEPLARFALAHEMAHVMKRHETHLTQARIIDALSLRGSVKDFTDTIRNPSQISAQILSAAFAGKNIFARHYAGQELDSDACSVRVLASMSKRDLKDVDASVAAFLAFLPPGDPKANRRPDKPDLIELVSKPIDVHPTTDERRKNLMTVRADITQSIKAATK